MMTFMLNTGTRIMRREQIQGCTFAPRFNISDEMSKTSMKSLDMPEKKKKHEKRQVYCIK